MGVLGGAIPSIVTFSILPAKNVLTPSKFNGLGVIVERDRAPTIIL